MAEVTLNLRHLPKSEAYTALKDEITAVLSGIRDEIAAMATMSCLIAQAFGHLWVGFYRVVERDRLLRIGPYQGSLGCLEIEFGQGVCGTAARDKRTVVVEDVDQFPGHIRCDVSAQSEIVVPVFGPDAQLIAVLDVDSAMRATFDEADQKGLEAIVAWFAQTQQD